MPYVDLFCTDDYASIYYRTNTPRGNVSAFDPEKPTVILLHPFFLDSSWLDHQFGDPRLFENYNLIAFDMRTCGSSSCRPSGRHDSWVDAADLASCHQTLHLPPCHILALEVLSIACALRFAALFPEMCLSLTLCNVAPPTEFKWVINAYQEIAHAWSRAEDLESFEHVMKDCTTMIAGPECECELRDELIAFWEVQMPPSQMLRVAETLAISVNRTPLPPEVYACITHPVLLIHGERNNLCPTKFAEKLVSSLTNAEGGAILYTVKGASNTLSIVPGHASIANQVFYKFLSRLPSVRSDLVVPEVSHVDRMKIALNSLAEMLDNPELATRDPLSSLSFSCLPPELVERQMATLREYKKGLHTAFNPCGPDGRPLRKYSDKISPHWFHGEQDGLSIAGTTFLLPERVQDPDGPSEKPTPVALLPSTNNQANKHQSHNGHNQESHILSLDTKFDRETRTLRRPSYAPGPVDKMTLKSPMVKVVTTVPQGSLHRLVL